VLTWGADSLYGLENVIVVVFDSDSRIPSDFLERVTPYFADPSVVGVQSAVRMYNAGRNWLTFWQDLEFVVWARIFSRAKDRLGSATLGGNGQCVRLSALMALGAAPWRPSLTEDLDLSLRLILNGGRIRFCGDAYVAQEAVTHVPQLIRQRARWIQGHLVTWEHLPAVLRSSAPLRVRLDLAVLLVLPAGLVPLALATVGGWQTFLASLGSLSLEPLLVWYVLAFASAPLTVWALIREGELDRRRAILQAHLFLAYSTFWMVAAARAVWSIIRGDRAWAKTSRNPASVAQAEQREIRHETDRSPVGQARLGHVRGLGSLGSLAAIAIVASSTLVLVAAAVVSGTYEEVTNEGAHSFLGGVEGITGRPPETSGGLAFVGIGASPEPTETIGSPSASPSAAVAPAPTGSPTPTPTQIPVPKQTPGPLAKSITARFPELRACPWQSGCYIYVVRAGNNFFSIVNYFRVDYDTVLRMNPSLGNPARIRPGDEIRIPTPRRR
jgi:hypothetical protein